MIELVFVIVILGILASIAIPRLAASRDDARAVSLKQDIGTMTQAIPAWYQGQRQVSIEDAISIDTTLWQRTNPADLDYTYNDGAGTIRAALCAAPINSVAANVILGTNCTPLSAGVGNTSMADNDTTFTADPGAEPWLVIQLNPAPSGVVRMLVRDMNVTNQTVPMAGRRVQWN
jgi:general secretion pathway protein G